MADIWDFCDTSKLYSIQNMVNIPYYLNLKQSDQVIISRIRIGQSKLTYTYLFKGEQQPEWIFCDYPYIFGVFQHFSREDCTF